MMTKMRMALRESQLKEDRLSALPDEILLIILECLSLPDAVRTSTLSRRWRHLPLMLSRLVFDIDEFVRCSANRTVHTVMMSCCKATRKLLAPTRECSIKDLRLTFYLADLCQLLYIGRAVGIAVESGKIELLEFSVWPEISAEVCTEEHLMLFGRRFMSFFHDCPNAFRWLTSLTLRSLQFGEADVQTILNRCQELQVLSVDSCELNQVTLGYNPPVRFGYVPQLQVIWAASALVSWQVPFALSGWLSNTRKLSVLYLDFHDEMVWFLPEDPKHLAPIFSNLKSVHLYDIFPECDLKWTLLFLEAAPFLNSFYVKISRHICRRHKHRPFDNAEKTNVMYEASDSRHYNLFLLDIGDFEMEEKLISYIKLVMERAVALKKIHLYGKEQCVRCDRMNNHQTPLPIRSTFPNKKEENNLIRKQLTNGLSPSSIEIVIE